MTGRLRAGEVLPAIVLAGLGAGGAVVCDGFSAVDRPIDVAGLGFAAAAGLVLAARQRSPLLTLAATTALTWAYLAPGYPYGPVLVSFLVGAYTVARYLPLSRSAPAGVIALAVLMTHIVTHPAALPGLLGLLPLSAWAVVPFAIGVTVRLHREAIDRERADAVRRRVNDERLRIAQEVHDVVGHGLVAIKMQAEVALHLLATRPEQAEAALTAISRTSTEALEEVRATLTVVRGMNTEAAPGVNRLAELRDRMGEAGLRVRLDAEPPPFALPPAVDLAGYRVVQESLTNALRHGTVRAATVEVGYEADTMVIVVSNAVPHPARTRGASGIQGRAGHGLGIHGMRERVSALGGDLTAGPTPQGRFEVRARIPTGGRP